MARRGGPIAMRLKAFVRDYVRAERSRATALATAIDRPQSWVSEYIDDNAEPPRWADIDTADAICRHIGVRLEDFLKTQPVEQPPPLTPVQAEAQEIAEAWVKLTKEVREPLRTLIHRSPRVPDAGQQRIAGSPPERQKANSRTSAGRPRGGGRSRGS